ncbi:MAG: DUF4162 domain-containing protein, partial [Desulfotomaculales bacterium]
DNLSGGMKQKLALVCALLPQPSLLILDEPTYGVDPVSRKEFWKILYHLNSEGITILFSTPYMDEAELCKKVSLLDEGRLVATGSPAGLKKKFPYKILELRTQVRDLDFDFAGRLPGVIDAEVFGDAYHVRVTDAAAAAQAIRDFLESRGAGPVTLREIPPSIEDIFVSLTEKEAV